MEFGLRICFFCGKDTEVQIFGEYWLVFERTVGNRVEVCDNKKFCWCAKYCNFKFLPTGMQATALSVIFDIGIPVNFFVISFGM
jgi:hypothetical protein